MNALPPLFLAGLALALGTPGKAAPIYRIEAPGQPPLFTDRPAQLATPQAELGAAPAFPAQALTPAAPVAPLQGEAPTGKAMATSKPGDAPAPTIGIASPRAGEAVRANGGTITLEFTATPALGQGEALWVYLDDNAPQITTQLTLALSDVDRGEHRLRLERRQGEAILAREEQFFYVLRTALGRASL